MFCCPWAVQRACRFNLGDVTPDGQAGGAPPLTCAHQVAHVFCSTVVSWIVQKSTLFTGSTCVWL